MEGTPRNPPSLGNLLQLIYSGRLISLSRHTPCWRDFRGVCSVLRDRRRLLSGLHTRVSSNPAAGVFGFSCWFAHTLPLFTRALH
jgi:hypothetical protein